MIFVTEKLVTIYMCAVDVILLAHPCSNQSYFHWLIPDKIQNDTGLAYW